MTLTDANEGKMTPSHEKKLQDWHQNLSPLRVDLVGDFAGKELFAIHGDSLLIHCLAEASVDLTDGFQLLHAIHAVESLLARLKQRGCNFHIVWFRDHEPLQDAVGHGPSSYRRLLRAILIKHLEHHARHSLEPALVLEYDNFDCDAFQQYLAQNVVHCFLVLDDCAMKGPCSLLLGFTHRISVRGYSVALINNIEFVSSKVIVSVFSPSMPSSGRELRVEKPQPRPRTPIRTVAELELDMGIEPVSWSPWENGEPLSVKDVISFTGLCHVLLGNPQKSVRVCAVAYILHLSALRRCSLSQRSCGVTALDTHEQECLDEFFASFADACVTVVENLPVQQGWDAFDLLDGRIMRQIFKNLASLELPPVIADEAQGFAKRLCQLTRVDISDLIPRSSADKGGHESPRTSMESNSRPDLSVLPFDHPVLDKFLEPIRLVTDGAVEPVGKPKVFQELSHWHNAKTPIDPKHESRRPKDFWALKRDQRLMADMIAYSASLTNASGKSINPETIVTRSGANTTSVKSAQNARAGGAKAPKQAPQQAPQQARGKNKKLPLKGGRESAQAEFEKVQGEKNAKRLGTVVAFWDKRCHEFQAERNLVKRFLKADKYLAGLSKEDAAMVGAEVCLYTCNVLASLILDGSAQSSEMSLFAMMWSRILSISSMQLSSQSLSQLEVFSKALHMQLPSTTTAMSSQDSRKLPFHNVLEAAPTAPRLSLRPIEFQLKHCGPYLERSFDPSKDPRVPNFRPDSWQVKVLDAIDADKSLLVVAPTSAGKTFISFYAMKCVLQSSDDGILVYVAPTKALVNQIAAEIQARFSKSYATGGRSVWAIHTRDYRIHNPMGCQVLVTVPHILQIMLLAPSNAERATSWSRRVRRIIFDEVHCIGQAEDGVIWEQLLLLAPCPIIALSATVGNPGEFKSWLEASEKIKGFDLEMIVHSSRYSDLRKFTYTPPKQTYTFRGLVAAERLQALGLDEGEEGPSPFSFIHPVVSLINRNRGTLQDIQLEPRDCLALWRSMSKHQTKSYPIDDGLNPLHFLPSIAKKPDVFRWECALKNILEAWMQDPQSPFSAVRSDLGSAFFEPRSTSPDEAATNLSGFGVDFEVVKEALNSTALPLLTDLHRRGALPAILFHYDQDYCEKTLRKLQDQLTRAEDAWKLSSPEWNKKLAEYEKWKRTNSQADRFKKDKTASAAKGRSRDEPELSKLDTIRESSTDASKWESFDPEAPLDLFSFANRTTLLDSELASFVRRLGWVNIDPVIIAALKRGIAVHHAGMNRRYRQIVEMLFRKGFLTVVIATGTLALGLNMPCKTVVFFGNSIFLTTLNYLQGAGRAGRRGFDLLGNVVFTGMPPERALEVMSSRLPDLRGQFPLSTTLVLRLLGLLHHTENSEYASRAMRSLLSQTRLYLGGPSDQMAIQHHLRFSIEYLRRQQLLSPGGTPLNFSGLVGHLYFTENAVFAFHSLLKEGYFHEICGAIHKNPEGVLLELVLVLAHLFCRIPVRRSDSETMANIIHRSPSVVLLPPLPRQAEEVLHNHNRETLDIFRTYVSTFVEQHLVGSPDTSLPFTGHEIRPQQDEQDMSTMLETLPPTKLRSPFAALSGFTDEFKSIHELCDTVRNGVFLEESAVPYIRIFPDDTAGVPWNAYIYDFFKNGDLTALVRDNGIKRGNVWFFLKDFSLVLATIVTSLNNFLSVDSAVDDAMMMDVQGIDDIMQEDRNELQGPEPTTTTSAVVPDVGPSANAGIKNASKKKPVLDSWEDDASDEGSSQGEETTTKPDASVDGSSVNMSPRSGSEPAWEGDGEENLERVLAAFRKLQEEFDTRFRKVWA